MKVTVVGAGFSGLTVAYELSRLGFEVEIHEQEQQAGGLIATHQRRYGVVETAANALLADAQVEKLFSDIGVDFAPRLPTRRKRYIFWQGLRRRWPLDFVATVCLAWRFLQLRLGCRGLAPQKGESIASWAERFGGSQFAERFLSPALQGIYAGNPQRMSATLVLKSLFSKEGRPPSGRLKGSVAPVQGMGRLITALTEALQKRGVRIHYGSRFELHEPARTPTVIATKAWQASQLLKAAYPTLSDRLAAIEPLSLVSVTGFFPRDKRDVQGFGCLFARGEGIVPLGVLFNDCVFAGRSDVRSETWIFGGAQGTEMNGWSDEDFVQRIQESRRLLGEAEASPLDVQVNRWPKGLPHYTLELENLLPTLQDEPPLYLHGNYLGELGLARIYARSRWLAQKIRSAHG